MWSALKILCSESQKEEVVYISPVEEEMCCVWPLSGAYRGSVAEFLQTLPNVFFHPCWQHCVSFSVNNSLQRYLSPSSKSTNIWPDFVPTTQEVAIMEFVRTTSIHRNMIKVLFVEKKEEKLGMLKPWCLDIYEIPHIWNRSWAVTC